MHKAHPKHRGAQRRKWLIIRRVVQEGCPKEVILKLVLMDEEDQHFKMATKASHTTVQRGHGEQFQV